MNHLSYDDWGNEFNLKCNCKTQSNSEREREEGWHCYGKSKREEMWFCCYIYDCLQSAAPSMPNMHLSRIAFVFIGWILENKQLSFKKQAHPHSPH